MCLYTTSEIWGHLQHHGAGRLSFLIPWNTATTDELWGSFYGMETFVSFNDRHPDLVSKSCLGGPSRCQRWLAEYDITSCVCSRSDVMVTQSSLKRSKGRGQAAGDLRPPPVWLVYKCRFALILPKCVKEKRKTWSDVCAKSAFTQNLGLYFSCRQ